MIESSFYIIDDQNKFWTIRYKQQEISKESQEIQWSEMLKQQKLINRDLGKANEITKDTHSTNINVEPQVIEYLTNPGKLKEDIGKAKDEIEAVGAVAKAAFNTIGSKEKNSFFDFLRTERVQETVRNLGYIDTKGKTKEQIAQEMLDKYGEIFVKNGKKLEINFYVNSEVSQDDPNGKNKMNSAGFVAEDGSIWLNAINKQLQFKFSIWTRTDTQCNW